MIHTPLCDWLGLRYPIFQGGMAWVATAELVVAVSEAGALGILGAGNAPPDYVAQQIQTIRAQTDRPFGVNIPLFSPYVEDVVTLCAEERVPVVTTGAGNPAPYIETLHKAGVIVIPVVASVPLAKRLVRYGADAVIAEGMESGGHIGEVATMALVPQIVDAVDVPVIAAGGIADGRGLAAALALGAVGVQMGTRFICSTECIAHPNYKKMIVNAGDRSTIVTGTTVGHPVRALKNKMTHQFASMELSGVSEEEILRFGTGRLRLAVQEGDTENGSFMAGQSSGLIHDILPVAEILARIEAEAEASLSRLWSYQTEPVRGGIR